MSGPDRRQVLILGGAAALAAAGAGRALAAGAPAPVLIADAALSGSAARRAARAAGARLVHMRAGEDPARVWSRRVAPLLGGGAAVLGLTRWADYLVLRGAGAEARLRVRLERAPGAPMAAKPAPDPALAARLDAAEAALDAAPDTAPGPARGARMAWALA